MRATVIVLDSLGIGALPDASDYGDVGSNTLKSCVLQGKAKLKNLKKLGLFNIDGNDYTVKAKTPTGLYARALQRSAGKDTTTGHWELMGQLLETPFPTFPDGFPEPLIRELSASFGRPILGNKAASGTEIIKELGQAQQESGGVIVYTSADSVLQIAAHTGVVPLQELYDICIKTRSIMQGAYGVGRVIARPFAGEPGSYYRTEDRHDYSLVPPPTLLDAVSDAGLACIGIGKISDIFAGSGLTDSIPVKGNAACLDSLTEVLSREFNGFVFCNLVDFDMLYGHRNDTLGYARALEAFDKRLEEILALMGKDDLLIITADHGCDPSSPSTDHSREYIPVLCIGKGVLAENKGTRNGFGCVGATVADWLGIKYALAGESLLR